MTTRSITGLVPILATPFTDGGELDLVSLARLAEFQLAAAVDGVAVFGMASEGFALTRTEREAILQEVRMVVGVDVPVIAGVNATSTATAIEQAREAIEGGADSLMVLPPFMVKPTTAQVLDFYGDVAAASGAPVMVQDAPGVTGVSISVDQIVKLSGIDGITSVKIEAPPTSPKVAAVAETVISSTFAILGGQNAQFCLQEYAAGATGTMPACEFPDLLAPILRSFNAGEYTRAHQEFARLLPLIVFGLQPGIAWAVHKEVLMHRGLIDSPAVRSPAQSLLDSSRSSLNAILDELALPGVASR